MPVLNTLRTFFLPAADGRGELSRDQAIRIAAAVLLLEMEHADFKQDVNERRVIQGQLQERFSLDEETVSAVLSAAREREDEAVSMHRYISTLNEFLEYRDKLSVLDMLWRVAYADEELHRYEEALLRRLAELLYIPHQDFVRVKLEVLDSLGIQY